MTLGEGTLAAELESLTPTNVAAVAVQRLADAYGVYMSNAIANGVAIDGIATGVSAMAGAMAFPVPGTAVDAGAAIAAGVAAFWAAMVAAPPTFFSGSTAIAVPPSQSALAAALAAALASNVGKSLADCAAALAAEMHTSSLGGTATFPGPVVAPIT